MLPWCPKSKLVGLVYYTYRQYVPYVKIRNKSLNSFSNVHVERFNDKKIYVGNRENHRRQKMNLIIHVKKMKRAGF